MMSEVPKESARDRNGNIKSPTKPDLPPPKHEKVHEQPLQKQHNVIGVDHQVKDFFFKKRDKL